MKPSERKPSIEKELRLSGKLTFEMLVNITSLRTSIIKKRIVTHYFDDSHYNLLKNGIALRKRTEKKNLLELKIDRGQGRSLEWASDLTQDNCQDLFAYKYQDLPSEDFLKAQKLIPQSLPFEQIVMQSNKIFHTDIIRIIWTVHHKKSIFTVCLDQGKIVCQNREQIINEIEIEVQQDKENLLLEFFGILWAKLPNSFYQGRSKALRGFELTKKSQLSFRYLKKPKTISTNSFKKIKIDLLRTITTLEYVSCLFCENGGKSPVNSLTNSLLETKTFFLFLFKASSIFNKNQLRKIIGNINRLERIISPTHRKEKLSHPNNESRLYKFHTDLLLSLYKFAETLDKFSGLDQ